MLKDLVDKCGSKEPPGVEVDFYYTCSCEVTAFPAFTGTGDDPDVRLATAFDFTGAPTGEGYWRKATAVVDKGSIKMGQEGEVGAEALFSGAAFYIKGTDSTRIQFAIDWVKASGCLISAFKPRNSADFIIVGSKAVPAFSESIELDGGGKVGDPNGTAYVIRANTPLAVYDEGLGIEVTPNV